MLANMRKPLVVEFAGTPKTGKGTLIEVIHNYFRRDGVRVKILAEGARSCPFDKSEHVSFTCWGANRVINHLLENVLAYGDLNDLLIMDRGLFDILAFLHLLKMEGVLAASDEKMLQDYILFREWRQLVDVVFLFTAPPEVALEREFKHLLVQRYGRIMNPDTLSTLNQAYEYSFREFQNLFKVRHMDTATLSLKERAEIIVDFIDERLQELKSHRL